MDVEKICRTCLSLNGPLLSIYDGSSGGEGCIADMLRNFTKTKPRRADNLPEKVCLACISEINRCYSFKLKCENSNRTLRQLLPDALAEEPDESTEVRVEQSHKSVQTTPERTRPSRTVHTQTLGESKAERVHRQVQTCVAAPSTCEKGTGTTSPVPLKSERNQTIAQKRIRIVKTNEPPERRSTRLMCVAKRIRSESPTNESLGNNTEIIMELQAAENDDDEETGQHGTTNIETGTAVYEAVRTEQLNANESTTYYELSNPQFDYDGHEEDADEGVKHETEVEMVSFEDDDVGGGADEQEQDDYTQIIYTEDESAVEEPRSDYDVTIYKNGNGEAEIVAKPITSTTRAAASSKTKSPGIKRQEQKCSECVMTFVSTKNLKRHMLKRHGRMEVSASEMQAEQELCTVIKTELKPVERGEANSRKRMTPTAEGEEEAEKFASTQELTDNGNPQPIVTTTKPARLSFFCDRCNAGFALQKSLIYHRKLNACTALTYSCSECERVFVSSETLAEHKASHLLGNTCNECSEVFETKDELSQHMINEHKRKLRNQCCVCKKVFTMLSALKDHMRVHSGEKPYLCPLCGKAFSQNANLKQHVMRHSKEKKFKCDECDNGYVTKAELFSHKRTHTGDQPFKCEYCKASFTTSSSLVKHKRKHTGERPYACDICPMRFTALNVLKNHRRTHTGEKPFKCFYCNKGFTQKGDCQIHQRTHGERNYACSCGEKFANLAKLRTHMKTHKKGDGEREDEKTSSSRHEADNVQAMHITIVDIDEDETEDTEASNRPLSGAERVDSNEELLLMEEEM